MSVAVGVGMTVVSGLLPARRATEVAPVSALRLQAEPGRFRLGVLRTAIIVLLGGGGAAVTAYGLAIEPGNTSMIVVACGGALVFLGVAAVLPVVAGPLGRAIGWVPGRLFGVPARLAAAGAGRNPRRTAAGTPRRPYLGGDRPRRGVARKTATVPRPAPAAGGGTLPPPCRPAALPPRRPAGGAEVR